MSPGTPWHKTIVQVSQVGLEDSWHATVSFELLAMLFLQH